MMGKDLIWVADNLEWAVLAVLVLASLPMIIKMIFPGKKQGAKKEKIRIL